MQAKKIAIRIVSLFVLVGTGGCYTHIHETRAVGTGMPTRVNSLLVTISTGGLIGVAAEEVKELIIIVEGGSGMPTIADMKDLSIHGGGKPVPTRVIFRMPAEDANTASVVAVCTGNGMDKSTSKVTRFILLDGVWTEVFNHPIESR